MKDALAPWDQEDAVLAKSIFGTADQFIVRAMISKWVHEQFGVGLEGLLSFEMSVGAAAAIRLTNGQAYFLKVWPGAVDRAALTAQIHVQAAFATDGFPAPRVVLGPIALGPGNAVLMALDQRGESTDVRIPGVRNAMAITLARLIRDAKRFLDLPGLPHVKPLVEGTPWPAPHNAIFDFQATTRGAEWIDAVAREALEAMASEIGQPVVGHRDWSAKNMRMNGDQVAVVYDWDSIFVDRETFIVGTAAAHFPVTWELPVSPTPTLEEVAAFVRSYELARGRSFRDHELWEVAASATYARAYKARCEHAIDTDRLQFEGSSRQALEKFGPYIGSSLRTTW